MWMDLYELIRVRVTLAGIGLFGVALIMLIADWIQNKERRSSGYAILLVIVLMALAASMI